MKVVSNLPHKVKMLENVWIPLSDATRLAARVWLPEEADTTPVPAILEYIPYRKRDSMRVRDEIMHRYFAGHGYACLRVDLRGSGDSEGILEDEYLQRELDDGIEVIDWIGRQSWCDGNVGMIGISWGGFNGLQIAAMQPQALKAVVSVCSTDDRYADDIHHMGGCLLGDNLSWASTMFAYNSLPPDPEVVGEHWRDLWFQRLEGSGLWLEKWLRHQHRDAYWQHGSICEDWSAVQCPVMAVSGWADGYSNAVFRLLANLQAPRLGIIGPWSHKYPHQGIPGPAIGFLQECLRWWDYWLKGIESGIMQEPMLRAWMQESVPPTTYYEERPGRWVAESSWPSNSVRQQCWTLARPGRLETTLPVEQQTMTIQSPLSVGLFAGKWCSYAATPDLPHDQREEDGGALVFDSEPLESPVDILGATVVELKLASDRPVGMVAVRLSDVAPDDKATRVTYGLLNLTHRNGSDAPQALEPGQYYAVRVQLNDVAQTIPAGHRLRLSVSTSYWPLAWPPPEPVRLSVVAGASRVQLPVREERSEHDAQVAFAEPEGATPSPTRQLEPKHQNWRVIRDLASDLSTLEVINDNGTVYLEDIDLSFRRKALEWYSYQDDDFSSPRGETRWEYELRRRHWRVSTVTHTILTASPEYFFIHAQLDAFEGEHRVYSANWETSIPRELV